MKCPTLSTATRLPGLVLSNGHFGVRRNGNGHGLGENGHGENGRGGNGHAAVKVMKRRRSHMWKGLNRAACAAYGAVLLIQKCGFTIEQAIACTGSNTTYIDAMGWLVADDDQSLLGDVLHGQGDIVYAAKQVRPLVELRTAYGKLSPQQRIQWAEEEGPNILFDEVIVPAADAVGTPTKKTTTFVERRA